jgi:hypothetical protein
METSVLIPIAETRPYRTADALNGLGHFDLEAI